MGLVPATSILTASTHAREAGRGWWLPGRQLEMEAMMQRTKVKRHGAVGGRTKPSKPIHYKDELSVDFAGGKVGARRWVRRVEKRAVRANRYEF
ncbi:hypothetical protein E1091_15900 [Micromonospora fluostatini]|uniref:Uncharacterized protein n=1 Tax=Micromonospora fluostatini TaxID=1629071 RepID=A0ABY2DE26_9ACTN|nr:hypothetical protein E1091_15900 [Micromonospora fluostatini]